MKYIVLLTSLLIPPLSFADNNMDSYFNTLKNNPQKFSAFLLAMPKGGDLHNHLAGATYAENMIKSATKDNFCIDPKSYTATEANNCSPSYQISKIPLKPVFYNLTIDAWSMRNFTPGTETGHDHFFATFDKFFAVYAKHTGEALAEVVGRAGTENEKYLELMVTPDNDASGMLGKKIGWDANLAQLRSKLLAGGLKPIIAASSEQINKDEAILHSQLHCVTPQAQAGCGITVRYLYQVLREQAPEAVFAQLLTGFELASKDPRFVGINMVQAEDGPISMRDYDLHMKMVGFLHTLYPKVNITLHAGELTSALVPTQGLTFHIRDAVEIAHAQRIGHGVDIMHETNADQLLQEMAKKHIAVEINLTSNDVILNVKGDQHPLPIYLKYNVPVVLSTDDEGVNRSNLTKEYQRAVQTYNLSYTTLKNIDRNSLTYSFVGGKSLWANPEMFIVVGECQNDPLGAANPSKTCQAFLTQNKKAQLQWQLEQDFDKFEKKFM